MNLSHEHTPRYIGYRYLPPRSLMEVAHLVARRKMLFWKCSGCGARFEGERLEEMTALQRPDFRPNALAKFGWSIDLRAKEKKDWGQTKL